MGRPQAIDYEQLAADYLAAELGRTDGRSTGRLLAERAGISYEEIRTRLVRARRLGLLPKAQHGRRGARLVRVAVLAAPKESA